MPGKQTEIVESGNFGNLQKQQFNKSRSFETQANPIQLNIFLEKYGFCWILFEFVWVKNDRLLPNCLVKRELTIVDS